eukprot:scaffold11440_cov136-Isochrysis_galbana.AAC.4
MGEDGSSSGPREEKAEQRKRAMVSDSGMGSSFSERTSIGIKPIGFFARYSLLFRPPSCIGETIATSSGATFL